MVPEEAKEAMAEQNAKPTAEQMQEAVRAAMASQKPAPPVPTHLYSVAMTDGSLHIWKSGDMRQLVEAMPNVVCLGSDLFLYSDKDVALNIKHVISIKLEGAIVAPSEDGSVTVEDAESAAAEQK